MPTLRPSVSSVADQEDLRASSTVLYIPGCGASPLETASVNTGSRKPSSIPTRCSCASTFRHTRVFRDFDQA